MSRDFFVDVLLFVRWSYDEIDESQASDTNEYPTNHIPEPIESSQVFDGYIKNTVNRSNPGIFRERISTNMYYGHRTHQYQ